VGHTNLFDDLHRVHRARVTRLCRVLLADPDEAADAAQDVFAKLAHGVDTEVRPMDWGAWLTRVTVNVCRDRRRSGWWRWWHERGRPFDDVVRSTIRTPEDEAIGRETQLRVWSALERLPARQREVFALRQLEELSTAEVAAALDLTTGSVKQHLFRAVRALRRAMGEYT
jgi:RNA polymerase sigma-70 factor (ECF subfamily)